MSNYDQLPRDRLLLAKAKKEHLKLRAFGRTGPLRCFARYDGGWHVHIGETPSCTCPAFQGRHRPCKHIMKTILCILGGASDMAVQSTLTDKQLTTLFQPNSTGKVCTSTHHAATNPTEALLWREQLPGLTEGRTGGGGRRGGPKKAAKAGAKKRPRLAKTPTEPRERRKRPRGGGGRGGGAKHVVVIVGAPGAGKTTAAVAIMDARRADAGVTIDKTSGKQRKCPNPLRPGKNAAAGVVLDGASGVAWLGRYKATQKGWYKKNPDMEGADRLAMGAEDTTWSHLLRAGASPLAAYRCLVVDSCSARTTGRANLDRARAAGWSLHVRELVVARDEAEARCRARGYAGGGALSAPEQKWLADFDGQLTAMRARFVGRPGIDYKRCTPDEVVEEVRSFYLPRA
jgi:hypothetical protein